MRKAPPPGKKFTLENAKEMGRRGGLKSVDRRKRDRDMKEAVDMILAMPLNDEMMKQLPDIRSFKDLFTSNPDVQTAMLAALVKKALTGNVMACELVMNILGENPALKLETEPDKEVTIKIDYGDTVGN